MNRNRSPVALPQPQTVARKVEVRVGEDHQLQQPRSAACGLQALLQGNPWTGHAGVDEDETLPRLHQVRIHETEIERHDILRH